MKIRGQKIEGPNVEIIVIPRGGDREDLIFKAAAILDYEPFYAACPPPKPPMMIHKTRGRVFNEEDPQYKRCLVEHAERRLAWMVLKSLQATPDLEWEQAKITDPNTWLEYNSELLGAGLTQIEINRIVNGVMQANCLDENKMEEARKRFIAREAEELKESVSQKAALASTLPGAQPKDSE